jgi:uncharacterized protein GlcG (DUF336 family)
MITLEKAKQALEASEKKAKELDIDVTTVVVDDHGEPIAMSRMDEAYFNSFKFALTKARTSALLRMPSDRIAPAAGEGKPYFGITALFGGEMTAIAGGLPVLTEDGTVLGAVGVGGSPDPSQDVSCAEAAKKILEA